MNEDSVYKYIQKALVSGCSCALVSGCLNPIDVAKIQMQNHQLIHKLEHQIRMIPMLVKIYKQENIYGLSRGIVPSMLREIVFSSIRIGAYEPMRSIISNLYYGEQSNSKFTNPSIKYFTALLTGAIGSAIANPFDLIKTILQSSQHRVMIKATISNIISKHGVLGLFRGWQVTTVRAAIITSSQLGSYDTIKNNIFLKYLQFDENLSIHIFSALAASLITNTVSIPGNYNYLRFINVFYIMLCSRCHQNKIYE